MAKNPNNKEFVIFLPINRKEDLAESLTALCEHYHSLQLNFALPKSSETVQQIGVLELHKFHQCKHCKTIYNDVYGDDFNRIKPGVKFEEIERYFVPFAKRQKKIFMKLKFDGRFVIH